MLGSYLKKYRALLAENQSLREENENLTQRLEVIGTPAAMLQYTDNCLPLGVAVPVPEYDYSTNCVDFIPPYSLMPAILGLLRYPPSCSHYINEKHYSLDQFHMITDHQRRESVRKYASVTLR
jgi:hypothetical protein